jgi:tetratricopeptide (TPR) repeat protein
MKIKITSIILGTVILTCLPSSAQATVVKQNNERKSDNIYAQQSYHQREQDYIGYRRYEESQRQQAEFNRQQAEIARQKELQQLRQSIPELEVKRDYIALSRALVRLEEWEKGLDAAEKAVQANPNYDRAYTLRGVMKNRLGNVQGAIEDYSRAITINPGFFRHYHTRGLLKKNSDRNGAIQDIRMAIKLVSVDNRFNLIRDSEVASFLKELRSMGATQ